jgi:hypothetical protein
MTGKFDGDVLRMKVSKGFDGKVSSDISETYRSATVAVGI